MKDPGGDPQGRRKRLSGLVISFAVLALAGAPGAAGCTALANQRSSAETIGQASVAAGLTSTGMAAACCNSRGGPSGGNGCGTGRAYCGGPIGAAPGCA